MLQRILISLKIRTILINVTKLLTGNPIGKIVCDL